MGNSTSKQGDSSGDEGSFISADSRHFVDKNKQLPSPADKHQTPPIKGVKSFDSELSTPDGIASEVFHEAPMSVKKAFKQQGKQLEREQQLNNTQAKANENVTDTMKNLSLTVSESVRTTEKAVETTNMAVRDSSDVKDMLRQAFAASSATSTQSSSAVVNTIPPTPQTPKKRTCTGLPGTPHRSIRGEAVPIIVTNKNHPHFGKKGVLKGGGWVTLENVDRKLRTNTDIHYDDLEVVE